MVEVLEYLRLSWQDIENACRKISDEIIKKGFKDHTLVGVSRGGLVPLRLIADYLSSTDVYTIGMRFYEDIAKTAQKPEIILPVQDNIRGKDLILIDDISDSGKSLMAAREHLKDKGADTIVIATITKKHSTALTPDIYATETSAWVIFPWEVQETISRIIENSSNRAEALVELKSAGFEKIESERILKSYEKEMYFDSDNS